MTNKSEFKHTYTYEDLTEDHRKVLEEGVRLCGEALHSLSALVNYQANHAHTTGQLLLSDMADLRVGRDAVIHIKNAILARGLEPLMAVTTRVEKG